MGQIGLFCVLGPHGVAIECDSSRARRSFARAARSEPSLPARDLLVPRRSERPPLSAVDAIAGPYVLFCAQSGDDMKVSGERRRQRCRRFIKPRQPPIVKAPKSRRVHGSGIRDRTFEVEAIGSAHLPHQAFGPLDYHVVLAPGRESIVIERLDWVGAADRIHVQVEELLTNEKVSNRCLREWSA